MGIEIDLDISLQISLSAGAALYFLIRRILDASRSRQREHVLVTGRLANEYGEGQTCPASGHYVGNAECLHDRPPTLAPRWLIIHRGETFPGCTVLGCESKVVWRHAGPGELPTVYDVPT